MGYGTTGIGKTTLFSMMPNAIFIGLDDGGRRIINPLTQEPIQHIPGVDTFDDVRMALQQTSLFPKGSSCVIDTATLLERLAEQYVLDTVPLPKGGGKANNIKAYGWNDGSSHALDVFRLVFQDLDALIRRGVNVALVCQEQAVTVANPAGTDYLQACPKLHHDRQYSIMLDACAWADHVLRITYMNTTVHAEGKRVVGKVTGHDTTRAICVNGTPDSRAKSRTLGKFVDDDGDPIQRIAFDTPDDDSLWQFIFPDED